VAATLEQARTAADGETIDIEHRVQNGEGRWRWVLNRVSVLRRRENGDVQMLIGLMFDVTARREAEQALLASRAQMRSIMEHAPDLIARLDARGRITFANQPMQNATLCQLAETNAFAWVIPEDARVLRDVLTSVFVEAKTTHIRLRVHRLDGAERTYDCHFGPIVVGEAVESAIVIARDVTKELHAAELLRQKESELAHAMRLSTSVGMLAGISHEVNQPLYAISNFASAAKRLLAHEEGPKHTQVREWLTKINEQAGRAGDIIQSLRELVRKADPVRESHDLNLILRDSLRLVEADARRSRIRLHIAPCDCSLPCKIDRVQVEQVLVNLLRNAIDAMEYSNAEDRKLVASSCLENADVVISVMDRGSGLPQSSEERVFDPFFTTKQNGLGLGLAICRNIVTAHGGRLWATPNVGAGCTFHVSLPLEGATQDGG
jgi:two-component system sensor kinase FixL